MWPIQRNDIVSPGPSNHASSKHPSASEPEHLTLPDRFRFSLDFPSQPSPNTNPQHSFLQRDSNPSTSSPKKLVKDNHHKQPTSLSRDNNSSPGSPPTPRQGTQLQRDGHKKSTASSSAPWTVAPTFTKPGDVSRASRQKDYAHMPPAEKKKQDEWLKKNLFPKMNTGCPAGFDWERIVDKWGGPSGGYVCTAGSHIITDAMIAEGKGGMWLAPFNKVHAKGAAIQRAYGNQPIDGGTRYRWGPYYPRDSRRDLWFFAGSLWNVKDGTVLTIGEKDGPDLLARWFLEWRRISGFNDPDTGFQEGQALQ